MHYNVVNKNQQWMTGLHFANMTIK